eukprot:9147567-Karenia_brevis.AAC.1
MKINNKKKRSERTHFAGCRAPCGDTHFAVSSSERTDLGGRGDDAADDDDDGDGDGDGGGDSDGDGGGDGNGDDDGADDDDDDDDDDDG